MIKIVADNKIPFLKGVLEGVAQVEYLPGNSITNHHLKDADALMIRTRTQCNEALLKNTPIKFIATATIGFDHIDINYCRSAGIRWVNAPGCNSGSVKQYMASALAYIIGKKKCRFEDLTIGIIGVGHVGSKVEALSRALGIKTLVNDPPRQRNEGDKGFVDLDDLLTHSDIVTLHVPLQYSGEDKTHHMAGQVFFGKMKTGAWLINTSRGEVAETNELYEVIAQGFLAGCIVDVWEKEPEINADLLQLIEIGTPHIAGYSTHGKANGTSMSVQALSRFFGLGLDDWKPEAIPGPPTCRFSFERSDKTPEKVFIELAMLTYDIEKDSLALKNQPRNFELLRGNYPVRREAQAYTIQLRNEPAFCYRIAEALGFNISQISE